MDVTSQSPPTGQHTLLIRLAGPMQAWGTQSRFTHRETDTEPSKSGVIGMIAAALGKARDEDISDLGRLLMAVRVDFEGVIRRDFQTIGGTNRLDDDYGVIGVDRKVGKNPIVSPRWYLADADFLVGLSGTDLEQLVAIRDALAAPRWPLFLGRKACPPGVPVTLPGDGEEPGGLFPDTPLTEALRAYPWPRPDLAQFQAKWIERWLRHQGYLRAQEGRLSPVPLRVVFEADATSAEPGAARTDQPYGTSFETRRFLPRYVRTERWHVGAAGLTSGGTDVDVPFQPWILEHLRGRIQRAEDLWFDGPASVTSEDGQAALEGV